MKKRFIRVDDCIKGLLIAEDVVNAYGAVLVTANTVMNGAIKDKLLEHGIEKIKIFIPNLGDHHFENDPAYMEASIRYSENSSLYREIFLDLAKGKTLDMQKVNEMSDSLYEQLNNERHIISCIHTLKSSDEYTYMHSINVSLYAMMIGKWLKLSKSKIKEVIQVGLLHDIGKVKIPPEILNKKEKLEPEEFNLIKRHATLGFEIVSSLEGVNESIRLGVLMHHERENGSGYPLGIHSDSINLYSKIIAIADVYDAITSTRVYKNRQTPFEAFGEFTHGMFGCFDSTMLSVFLKNIVVYYIGTNVLLSNSNIGEVVYINPQNISHPIVKINSEVFDLASEKELKILGLI